MSAAADIDVTRAHQRDASDPRSSAWVIANAGSGKTHVLTKRVVRLLLSGVDPAAILCLTFTKVAAAEMSRRVFERLGEWTLLDDAKLAAAITELEGRPPTDAEMREARRLFAKALETPGGLKIQTIHAFCERLLHAFPFEANVPGQFSVMDDSAAAAALAKARADVLNEAAAMPESPLGRSVRQLAEQSADMQIGEALDALIAKRDDFRRWIENAAPAGEAGSIDDALIDLRDRLQLAPGESEETICRELCSSPNWSREACRGLLDELGVTKKASDRDTGAVLHAILDAQNLTSEAGARIVLFLTGAGEPRAVGRRFSSEMRRDKPSLETDFASECLRILKLLERRDRVRASDATAALLIVGDAIIRAYNLAKRQAGALDFSDLISKTRNLLLRSGAAQWVLYKLDRRVEHILVDEAQDTSPDQWRVVQAIAEDFFSGEGASRTPRTIFAVGDDKQSIFRFQGAAPAMLAEMPRFFQRRIDEAKESFVTLPLYLSFRSTRELLSAVDTVFNTALAAEITASTYTAHASFREKYPGHVVVLPRTVRRKREEPEDWTAPYTAPSAAETELAERIADEIVRIRNTVLPSGKRLSDGEILILVRRRDAFFAAMNRALRARDVPTAGADRIPVSTHIAVLDLLALADVMLLPEDDLQLAACLKGPLLGVREDGLMQFAGGRGRADGADEAPAKTSRLSLWRTLLDASDEPFASIAAKLRRWRGMADQVTPFRFFATILGPEGGRRGFRARLGGEADDVLDTFLSQALAYEATEAPSLQGFVRFIRANESDIKRESDEAAAGVRVMTVHGAKGLEADVVFLADTGGAAVVPGQRKVLVDIGRDRDDPAFLWRRRVAEMPDLQRIADAREDRETESEYLRLLYVAMTRARDVLYVGGVRLINRPPRCWYTIVEQALVPKDVERDEEGELAAPYEWPQPPRPPLAAEAETPGAGLDEAGVPDWLNQPAPSPELPPQPLRPSVGLAEPDPLPAIASDVTEVAPGEAALLRGRVVHLLLELLPNVPAADRRKVAERVLMRETPDDADLAQSILAEAEAVLADQALAEVFGPKSRAELAIVGHVATERGDYAVSGRIDRMLRDSAGWRIVDFKTNRTVPAAPEAADPAYVLQLALYRRLLMEMEPGVEVSASLVWTAGPNVMPIPAALMEQALATLGIRGNPVS
ncbi:MAG: double-strand break repair helicase AddA [Propylenella sp.]